MGGIPWTWIKGVAARRKGWQFWVDLLLFVFLATAAVGVWAAYDRAAAWSKFGLIVSAVLLYYLAESLSRTKPGRVIQGTFLLGLGVAGYFLLLYHLGDYTGGSGLAHWLDQAWVAVRMAVIPARIANRLIYPDLDQVSAVAMMVVPLAAVWSWRRYGRDAKSCVSAFARLWKRDASDRKLEKRDARYCVSTGMALGAIALLLGVAYLTGEAGPLLVLLVVVGLGLWVWFSGWLARNSSAPEASRARTRSRFLWGGLALGLAVALIILAANPARWMSRLNRFLGAGETGGRLEIWDNSLDLLPDFFLTGGGLASFPGLYSHYILALPYEYLGNSHNLLLEAAVEQGVFGSLALAGIWGISFARLAAARLPDERAWWRVGVLGSGLAAALLALTDNILYNSLDILLLFWLPGLASGLVAAAQAPELSPSAADKPAGRFPGPSFPAIPLLRNFRSASAHRIWAVTGLVLVGLLPFYRPLYAAVYANFGAVAMARAELAQFPLDRWQDGRDVAQIEPYAGWFERVLQLDPDNRTAHHRLGWIAYVSKDYSTAVSYLESTMDGANMDQSSLADRHRGIRKTLGYSYTWMGEYDRAIPLLSTIPEAAKELISYEDWWAERGRTDLAANARQMVLRIRQHQAGMESE